MAFGNSFIAKTTPVQDDVFGKRKQLFRHDVIATVDRSTSARGLVRVSVTLRGLACYLLQPPFHRSPQGALAAVGPRAPRAVTRIESQKEADGMGISGPVVCAP